MAAITSNTVNGNWSAPGSWSPAQVPVEGDTVTIQNGHTISLDDAAPGTIVVGADTTTPAIQIAAGGTLQYLATAGVDHVLQLKGDLKVAGTLSIGTVANPIPAGRKLTIKTNYSASLSSGKYGLIIQAGGTLICQGNPLVYDRCFLAADAGGYCNVAAGANPIVTRIAGQGELMTVANGYAVNAGFYLNGTRYTIKTATTDGGLTLQINGTPGALTSAGYQLERTALVTDVSTGWKDNDQIALASTSRTYSDCEVGTLNGDASGTALTVDGFLGTGGAPKFAHIGTSPCQAEVINLTRNVVITAYNTAYVGYVVYETTAQVDVDWTEFAYMGENTTDKYGVVIKTTTGSCNLNRCSFHDFEDGGIFVTGSTHNNWTVQNCVGYNLASLTANHGINVSGTTGTAWILNNNIVMLVGVTAGNGIVLSDVGGTCTNNTVVGARGAGISLNDSGPYGVFSGYVAHSCGTYGIAMSYNNSNNIFGSATLWRNANTGAYVSASQECSVFNNWTLFGNGSNEIAGHIHNDVFNSLTINNDAVFSCPYGISGDVIGCIFNNSNFGVTLQHSTCEFLANISLMQVYLYNCTFGASTTVFSFLSTINAPRDSFVRVTRLGGVPGLAGIKSWFLRGNIIPDTTYYQTASPSQKLSPSSPTVLDWAASTAKSTGAYVQPTTHNNFYYYAMNAGITAAAGHEPTWPTAIGSMVLDNNILWLCISQKLESGKKQFAIASGQTATITVWLRKSAAYNGNQPRLMLKANPDVGVNSDTVLATMAGGVDVDVGPGTFTQLSGTTPAASQDGVMEVVVDCDGTAGFVNVDLWGFA